MFRVYQDTTEEAKRIISLYDCTNNSLDFTIYLTTIEKADLELFNEVLNQLKNGKYSIKYLNGVGTS